MSTNPTKLQPQPGGTARPLVFPLKEKNDNAVSRYLYFEHLSQQSSAQKPSDTKLQVSGEKQPIDSPEFSSAIYNNLNSAQPQHFFLNLTEIPGPTFQPSQKKCKSNLSTTPSRESENLRHDNSYEVSSKPNFALYTPSRIVLQAKGKDRRISPSPPDKKSNGNGPNNSVKKKSPLYEFDHLQTVGDVPFSREKVMPTKNLSKHLTPQKLRTPNSDPQDSKLFNSALPKSTNRLLFSKKAHESSPTTQKNNITPYSPIRLQSQHQLPADAGHSDSKVGTSKPNSSSIIPHVKESIKNITLCREHNNQPLVFFNSLTKQLACVECVYSEIGTGAKKSTYLTVQNAFNEISELNKSFKLESQEKIYDIDSQLQIYKSNYTKIQENLHGMLESLAKEFRGLYDKLQKREENLTALVREAANKQQRQIKTQIEDLEFLKCCYRDAKEVNPNSSTEQGVHFYAVFNLLKNSNKNIENFPEHFSLEAMDRIEFDGGKEIEGLIEKFGKMKTPKTKISNNMLKRSRRSVGSITSSQKGASRSNRSFEVKTPSPVREVERRATTPNKRNKDRLSPPPTSSYLEREGWRNKMKSKDSQAKQPRLRNPVHEEHSRKTSSSPQRPTLSGKDNAKASGAYKSLPANNATQASDNAKKGSHGSIKITKSTTESTSPAKMDSTRADQKTNSIEFISPAKSKNSSSYFGIQQSGDQSMVKFQESLDRIFVTDLTKESDMYFESASFNGENSFAFFMDSKILTDAELRTDIASVLNEQILEAKLLYRLSSDGPSSEMFHSKCDNEAPVLAIVHANQNYIFGYYLPVPFAKAEKYTQCEESFIFSLRNPEFKGPRVFPIRPDKKFIAFYQSNRSPCLGSTIINKQDLLIDLDEPRNSCSNVGYAYKLSAGVQGTTTLAGRYSDWEVHEIEFYKIKV